MMGTLQSGGFFGQVKGTGVGEPVFGQPITFLLPGTSTPVVTPAAGILISNSAFSGTLEISQLQLFCAR